MKQSFGQTDHGAGCRSQARGDQSGGGQYRCHRPWANRTHLRLFIRIFAFPASPDGYQP
jgi:hypothetical protein